MKNEIVRAKKHLDPCNDKACNIFIFCVFINFSELKSFNCNNALYVYDFLKIFQNDI